MVNKRYQELRDKVVANDGMLTIKMGELRLASGHYRIGQHVKSQILNDLRSVGLCVYPQELPDRQDALVRIWVPNSKMGRVINSVFHVDFRSDTQLREMVSARFAERKTA